MRDWGVRLVFVWELSGLSWGMLGRVYGVWMAEGATTCSVNVTRAIHKTFHVSPSVQSPVFCFA